ncbi:group I truncated hemoglobin [Rheinheimera maricola]|uniref:Group 1 truncated hemoglobin n=1 Tax=Rheinheimera maricola TaxID=2793282 RepID=A0ABS7XB18_9GAMM|nr:group 1 truncated hemoglobin [Rheinheimera maricola]MBZ9612270.1 group 1 truncated hemoglobin [Rheinheimera maricola]
MQLTTLFATALFFLALLSGCSQRPESSLYQQLGGEDGIASITDGLLREIEQDQRIVHHFADTDIERFRKLLAEQLCELSGGPCRYSGGTMQQSHTGFNISLADYDALVDGLIKVMQQQKISISAQNQLLALLAPMYKDISYR